MTGAVTRKIELSKQIEELERELGMRGSVYPGLVQRRQLRQGEADERNARLEGAIATLKFCQENEHLIRQWAAERKGQEDDR